MKSQGLKKIIIFILLILLIIIIAIIFVLKLYLSKNGKRYIEDENAGTNIFENYGKGIDGKIDSDAYFDIKKYMQKYIDTINLKNLQYGYYNENKEYISVIDEKQIKQKIYNLLSNKYIEEKQITVDNLYNYIDVLQKDAIFVPIEMTLIQEGEIKSFLVHGIIESAEDYSVIDEIFVIANIDMRGYKYSIEPIEGDYNNISEINIGKLEDTIIENEDNEFYKAYVKSEDIPTEYIEVYKGLALGAPEKLYNLLDQEYRNAKFSDLDEFKNYIQKNKTKIIKAKLDKYQVEVDGNKVRYVCIDKNGNYYVINQNEALVDYTIMLDTYTIDLPEFIEKYNTSQDNIKVALNIEKLVEATKYGDYKYVYNKLDTTFKSSKFKTQTDFEKYIKEKYNPEEDTIKYKAYQMVTGLHIYNIEVTDKSESKTIEAKVVMKIDEGRDFKISFSGTETE